MFVVLIPSWTWMLRQSFVVSALFLLVLADFWRQPPTNRKYFHSMKLSPSQVKPSMLFPRFIFFFGKYLPFYSLVLIFWITPRLWHLKHFWHLQLAVFAYKTNKNEERGTRKTFSFFFFCLLIADIF